MIEPIFAECYPAKPKGHRHVDLRRVLNGSIFRLHTGCHRHQLPKRCGDDSTGANGHDTKWLAAILEAIVVERPQSTEERPQPLCLDKGDNNPTGRETVATCPYIPHIRRIDEETLDSDGQKTYPPGGGWWNGRCPSSPNVEASSCGMRKRPSIS
jgi:hypothetical protein